MKSTFAVLLATTAVVGALAIPTLDAFARDTPEGTWPAVGADGTSGPEVRLATRDDDRHRDRIRRDHHDDDDDDDNAPAGRGTPAPAGTVAPPTNGLFGTGAPPKAVTN
ncbi:hypothetical protein [Phaeovulum sp. NW3]|uniref:hypothetical protein n=1 Tax=Phaeovulum sp. NW3 TaxID=2934933 RepID=UPI0020223930|nr:hypothetical protein [Phaeovulum sp. NW3]MCL7466819.1 hypothetical protein [Phaeovulum sp. NW3]